MKISDLPRPVTSVKVDWLPGVNWLGFTPLGNTPSAVGQCESAIKRQAEGGYILEYVTVDFGKPNPGFEADKRLLDEKQLHSESAGCLVAVHQIDNRAQRLEQIVGPEEYAYLQRAWAKEDKPYRWGVAFRIVESYVVVGRPRADAIFTPDELQRWRNHPSGTLRVFSESERRALQGLEISRVNTPIDWSVVSHDLVKAEMSSENRDVSGKIEKDFMLAALEGYSEEQKSRLRKRATWLADQFVRNRAKQENLICDECGFDPRSVIADTGVRPRSLLDVHHKSPLEIGLRLTTLFDFALLCPTCHRFEHRKLKISKRGAPLEA